MAKMVETMMIVVLIAEEFLYVDTWAKDVLFVRLIQVLRAAGRSLRAIAQELELSNFRTKSGGTRWTHTAVQSILKRAVLTQ